MSKPVATGILEHITLCEDEWAVRQMLDQWGRSMAHEVLRLRVALSRLIHRGGGEKPGGIDGHESWCSAAGLKPIDCHICGAWIQGRAALDGLDDNSGTDQDTQAGD